MSFAAAFILAASTALLPAPALPSKGSRAQMQGAQVASAQASATILGAAVVRQASGPQPDPNGPAPQISRRGRTVQVEFQ